MMTEKERFMAVAQDGTRRTIVEYQRWVTFQPLNGPAQKHKGSTELFTDDGLDVTTNPDGTFTILQTDEVVQRVDRRRPATSSNQP